MSLLTNLLAWYKLDEAAGSSRADSSGNGNTLSETGGTVAQVTGLIGHAAGFTGSGSSYLNLAATLFSSGSWSFSCFVKPTDLAATYTFMGQAATSTLRQNLTVLTSGKVKCNVGNVNNLTSTGTISSGSWSHVVGTYDGSNCRLYLNGVYDSEAAKAATYTSITAFCLGSLAGGFTFNGAVDLAGVWSRQLTDGGVSTSQTAGGEVAQLYNGGAGLDYPFTVATAQVWPYLDNGLAGGMCGMGMGGL